MTRLNRLNASNEYAYRVSSAIVFGSMLSDVDGLGDVDIALELEPRVTDEAKFCRWCNVRREIATRRGTHFSNSVDLVS